MKHLPRYNLLLSFLLLSSSWCLYGAKAKIVEPGKEDNYDFFTISPASDLADSDQEKFAEREDAVCPPAAVVEEAYGEDEGELTAKKPVAKRSDKETRKERKQRAKQERKERKERERKERTKPEKKTRPKKEKKEKVKEEKKPIKVEEEKPKAILAEDINYNEKALNKIYEGISGFGALKDNEHEEIVSRGGFPTYGEILYSSLQSMLNEIELGPKDVFIDFGCGVGKVTMQVYLNTPVKESIGVELSETRYDRAIDAYKKLKERGLVEKGRTLEYIHDSMLDIKLPKNTKLGYTCSTCFSDELMHALMEKIAKLKKGFIFLTLRELPSDFADYGFELKKHYLKDMTWAKKVSVYMYELVK